MGRVHTVYVPADQFTAAIVGKWVAAALAALDALAVGLDGVAVVWPVGGGVEDGRRQDSHSGCRLR
jgi:hypothetical protein